MRKIYLWNKTEFLIIIKITLNIISLLFIFITPRLFAQMKKRRKTKNEEKKIPKQNEKNIPLWHFQHIVQRQLENRWEARHRGSLKRG